MGANRKISMMGGSIAAMAALLGRGWSDRQARQERENAARPRRSPAASKRTLRGRRRRISSASRARNRGIMKSGHRR